VQFDPYLELNNNKLPEEELMKNALMMVFGVLMINSAAQAETSCPNLSGKWNGTCEIETNQPSNAVLDEMRSMVQPVADELEIKQLAAPHPAACTLIRVDDSTSMIGGTSTKIFTIPVSEGKKVTIFVHENSKWEGNALVKTQVGWVQYDTKFHSIKGSQRYELKADGSLAQQGAFQVDDFAAKASCQYNRQP
jgi:hypothetical protein